MPPLPAIELGGLRWQFFWSDASLWAATQALLADGDDAAGWAPLAEAMWFDPGLVAWCVCAARLQSCATPWNPPLLARLFCQQIVRHPSSAKQPRGPSADAAAAWEQRTQSEAHAAAQIIQRTWPAVGAAPAADVRGGMTEVAAGSGYLQRLAAAALLAAHPQRRDFIEETWPELRGLCPAAVECSADFAEECAERSAFLAGATRHWQFRLPQGGEVFSAIVARLQTAIADSDEQMARRIEAARLEGLAEFAAGAGHEMNNPLAVISGRAQLLLRSEPHAERRRDLAVIHAQALRVHEMIADAMLFARPPLPRRQRVDVGTLLARIVADLRPLAADRAIALDFQPLAEPCAADVDPAQFIVALRAVLDNAVQAIGRAGRVAVELAGAAEEVIVIVADDGPGIPAPVRPYVFDPFFSGRSAGRGLGLGLSKAWRIVTQHGGQIQIAEPAPPATGTRVVLRWPRRE